MDFSKFTTISFDCYGTLIDWEAGIIPTLRTLLANHGKNLPDDNILELYGEFEALAEGGEYRTYRNVLRSVVCAFAERLRFKATSTEIDSLAESVASWPPFPDTVAALHKLHARFRLVVISNIDDDLFAATRKLLGTEFDGVITAEQARSYKPSSNNFQLALRRLGLSPGELLHAAQSIYHDVVPARALGIPTVWVNRRSARPGIGAVRAATGAVPERTPDIVVPDLATLAEMTAASLKA
jgi:2-haloacid dehalogenase